MEDRRCKLGLAGRLELVLRVEQGASLRAAAAALDVAPATAHRWWHRWRAASEVERADRSCLATRRPVPGSCPWALTGEQERAILHARAKANWGPMQLQLLCGRHRSTIWKVLKRHGVSRQRRSERPVSTRRYEGPRPVRSCTSTRSSYPSSTVPATGAHGDRSETHRTRKAGKVKVIGVIDDHTRLAYRELHAKENAAAVSATLRRAAAWFAEQGCGPVQAVMSDNAKCYTSHQFRDTLRDLPARQILTPPRTPRWNGKESRGSSAP